jgi:hypothetical protein
VPLLPLVEITKPSWLGGRRLVTLAQEGADLRSPVKQVSHARSMEVGSAETLPAPTGASAVLALKAVAKLALPQCPLGLEAVPIRSWADRGTKAASASHCKEVAGETSSLSSKLRVIKGRVQPWEASTLVTASPAMVLDGEDRAMVSRDQRTSYLAETNPLTEPNPILVRPVVVPT